MTGGGETEREEQNITALLYFYFFKNWEENYESDLQSHLEPGEALLCGGFGNRRQLRKKWGGWLLKRRACLSVRFCAPLPLQGV